MVGLSDSFSGNHKMHFTMGMDKAKREGMGWFGMGWDAHDLL